MGSEICIIDSKSAVEYAMKEDHSSTAGGSANFHSLFGKQYGGFLENWESIYLKTQQYHSWTYTQKMHSHHKDICSAVFIVALFVIARTWKQPKCPSTDCRLNKENVVIYTMKYYSAVKSKNILKFADN